MRSCQSRRTGLAELRPQHKYCSRHCDETTAPHSYPPCSLLLSSQALAAPAAGRTHHPDRRPFLDEVGEIQRRSRARSLVGEFRSRGPHPDRADSRADPGRTRRSPGWFISRATWIARSKKSRICIGHIESVRDKYNLKLIYFDKGDEVINYLNNGQPRDSVKIANFEYLRSLQREVLHVRLQQRHRERLQIVAARKRSEQDQPAAFSPGAPSSRAGAATPAKA